MRGTVESGTQTRNQDIEEGGIEVGGRQVTTKDLKIDELVNTLE